MTDFIDEMEQLAAEIAKEARQAATAIGDKIDAFKALTPIYLQKVKNKPDGDDDGLPTFDNFQEKIHGESNGADKSRVSDRLGGRTQN